jgi:rhamnose transport system ATP-binding protein
MSELILELKHITKVFPGVKALDDVHFQLKPGEIHALMGENGAGKSTFIKIITGVHQQERGEMFFEGQKVDIRSPKDAQKLGIAAIYQNVTCYPDLTVTENIYLGHEETSKTGRILWRSMHEKAQQLLDELSADFSAKTEMGALSVAQQQIVEIAKALSTNARLIIMDEPTAALTNRECENLYRIAEQLRDNGVAIIFISHKFEDMDRLASRVTVFRDAKYIGSWDVNEISKEKLIEAMVGRKITQFFPKKESTIGKELLRVEGLSKLGLFADVSFSLREGEILGLTGLVGAGRTEVCETIFGIREKDGGAIYIDGEPAQIRRPIDAMTHGIGFLPEDRQKSGLVLEWEIGKNITLPNLEEYSKNGWLDLKKENEVALEYAQKVRVKAQSIFDLAGSLSGGNQQKVIVAKLLSIAPKIIIMDEPTKGIDVGAKTAIYEIMQTLVQNGRGIIMVSSEMLEVLEMSDRIVVMSEGRVTGELDGNDVTQEKILERAMAKHAAAAQ